MTKKYNSGRVQRLPQSGITSDRYEFLGLEQAEPDLGDPIVGVSSVEANPFNGSIYDWYLVGSDGSGEGKRYWLPKHIVLADFTRTAGSVTIRSNDNVIGFANGVSDLNFKGGISVTAPGSVAGIGNSAVDIEITSVPEADQAQQSANLQGGSPGSIPYQESADTTVFLPGAGTERQVLSYDTSSTAPIWRNILDLNPIEAEEKLNDQIYYLSYLVSAGSTSTIGISSSGLTFNPSQVKLGIGTDLPISTLDVNGDLNIVGLSTFSSDLDINASINVSGHSELGSINVSGISTFNLVNVIGISTFNDAVGINSTLTVSGISSFGDNVSISKTDALLNVASQSVFTGLTTVNTLTANALSPDGIDYGTNLYVPVANNSGSWSWQQVFDAGAGSIDGISIFENSTLIGEEIIALDFQNPNYSITVNGTAATIVFSNDPLFNTVSVGPGSEVGISSSGINVVGIVTSIKAIIGTGVTIDSSGVNVSGFVTTTDLKVTNNATIDNDLTVTGNLTVNGETTTINSTILTVDDKNISLASTETPSDISADGGGIILNGDTDHTILWNNTYDSWNFSEHVNISTGKEYKINNALVLDSTTLGAGVTNSSLKTLGTIITGVWEGTQIDDDYIGTINNANKVDLNALDIDGGTETTSIVDADLFIVDDGGNGTNRKVTASNIKSYIGSNISLSGSLNGDLDLNGYNIIGSTGNINITENIKAGIITATSGFVGNLTGTATTANNLNRDVTAGNGLTGGGTLTSNITLNVGAGTGIIVNADNIALKNAGSLTNNKVLKWDGTQLVNSNIEDTGSIVGVGTSIKLNFGIIDKNNSTGQIQYIPVADGSGGWTWNSLAGAGGIGGISVREETDSPFTGITELKFVGVNITASAVSNVATITVADTVSAATTAANLTKNVATPLDGGLTGGGTLTSNLNIRLKNYDNLSTNTLLKWQGTNKELTNSLITENGSLVGVGTSIKLEYGIFDKNNSVGADKNIPVADGNGGWSWNTVSSAGGIDGITISEEGSAVSASSFVNINFVGDNITATDGGSGIATVTLSNTPTFTDLNVTGFTSLSNVNSTGIITAAQLSTGAYGTGINIYSNGTINGPSEMVIDPAAIGNNTGSVRVKGDLYVDGSQFIVNSTTIELADFIVGIASTATTDVLADGAGIKIGPDNTILYDNTNTAFRSSENFNLVSGKTYKINGTDVLTSNTLGSGVVNSSLTSVGTLVKLDVGNINATGIVTAATYDVSSDINLKDNVQIIENPLDKIVKIDGVTFNWKADNKPSMGVIAQNIEEVLPELVSTGDTKHVNYNGIIGLLIEAIKELKSEIDELKGNK